MIPELTMGALVRYVEHGIRPGDFTYSVLTGDLYRACDHADDDNAKALFEIVRWLHNVPPWLVRGNHDKVRAWMGMEPEDRDHILAGCLTWQKFLEPAPYA